MPANTNRLSEHESLQRGERLVNGDFAFTLQDDGNLCLTFHGNYLWGTSTNDKDCQSVTMQDDGNLCLRSSNGDFVWGSLQSGGHMITGYKPYLRLHDNGDLGIYSSGDEFDNRIWSTFTGAIRFRGVNFINAGRNVSTYPLLKRADKSTILDASDCIDGEIEGDHYDEKKSFLLETHFDFEDTTCHIGVDFNTADFHIGEKGGPRHTHFESCRTEGLRHFRDIAKGLLKLGHSVQYGDDVWVDNQLFLYDPDSQNTVHIRKYGGQRDGNAVYDGVSTNRWFDSRPGWSRQTEIDNPKK